jgi:hypothetical protein
MRALCFPPSPLAHVYFFGRKLLKAYEPFRPLVTT